MAQLNITLNQDEILQLLANDRDEDYYYVRDKLNVSLQSIFREHGYNT